MKRKGSRIERELVDLFWIHGYAAIRSPGSGSSSHPVPDIIAGNGKRTFALEVKSRANLPIYLEKENIDNLLKFSKAFGAIPFIAVKIPRKKWKFIQISDLKKTKRGYKIDEDVFCSAINFDELINKHTQLKLKT